MFKKFFINKNCVRLYSDGCGSGVVKKGLVVGVYDGCEEGDFRLSENAGRINEETSGKLLQLIKGADIKRGKALVLQNIHNDFHGISVAGLGQPGLGINSLEHLDECKENIRVAMGVGAKALQEESINQIQVDAVTSAESAAEGAVLGTYIYQEEKTSTIPRAQLELFGEEDKEGWQRGVTRAEAQNFARRLEEAPANLMTPSAFAQAAVDNLCPCGISVDVRERDWMEQKKLNAFLASSRGSCEPPLLLEIGYCGGNPDDKPVVLIGKGVTFDSGGTCLKKSEGMDECRAEMAGAAVVVASIKAAAQLSLPINIRGLIPLCENMPGGMAMKPGDVVMALNGKSIRIEDTDNEGRIGLADILVYSNSYKPCLIVNIATLTPGIRKCLGTAASAVFSTSHVVWREMDRAGMETGDRVWRFPFWKYYSQKVTDYVGVDVNNVGKGIGGGPCLGAAFLKEFIPPVDFMHMDITGTGLTASGIGHYYLQKGIMSGRPTRTIIQFLYQMACPHDKGDEC